MRAILVILAIVALGAVGFYFYDTHPFFKKAVLDVIEQVNSAGEAQNNKVASAHRSMSAETSGYAPAEPAGHLIESTLPTHADLGRPFIRSARLMDELPRAHRMFAIYNPTDQDIHIREILINGKPLSEHLRRAEGDKKRWGESIDWFALRPDRLSARDATVLILGGPDESRIPLEQTRIELDTDQGRLSLAALAPEVESLKVANAAFTEDLAKLDVLVRNDGKAPVSIRGVELNGQPMRARVSGSPIPPGLSARIAIDLPKPMPYGRDCALVIDGDARATAWFRAHPAQTVLYPHYGSNADTRDLAEKHMDVHARLVEGSGHIGLRYENNKYELSTKDEQRYREKAKAFGALTNAWAWYMQDDTGWGKPTPWSLVRFGNLLRESGSLQPQFVCLPADQRRYAWTHDIYMNYSYLTTGQGHDPTIWTGDRNPDIQRHLSEPAAILYLVDCVGQEPDRRWIARAEEEMASMAMIGRGVRHPGWFLVPSVWRQGWKRGGGIDHNETRPQRYQEGATANPEIWNTIGRLGCAFQALAPWLAGSAQLPGRLNAQGVEVLPLLCSEDALVVPLLNRNLRVTYPDEEPEGHYGGITLAPRRAFEAAVPLPSWMAPHAVYLWDTDRGLRARPFTIRNGNQPELVAQIDALDTSALLLVTPNAETDRQLTAALADCASPAAQGPAIRPDAVIDARKTQDREWILPERPYRVSATVKGPLPAGSWIQLTLPAESDGEKRPLGYFDPRSVQVLLNGRERRAQVDYARPLSTGRATDWDISGNDDALRLIDTPEGVRAESRLPPDQYRVLSLKTPLDPAYDVLDIRSTIDRNGRIIALLDYTVPFNGQTVSRAAFFQDSLYKFQHRLNELLPPYGNEPLTRARVFWHEVARANERDNASRDKPANPTGTPEGSAGIRLQVYNGNHTLGALLQVKSRPDVYVRLPEPIPAGQTAQLECYWSMSVAPIDRFQALENRPAAFSKAWMGPREVFGIRTLGHGLDDRHGLSRLELITEARADMAWVEARDAEGVLTGSAPLAGSDDGLIWRLEQTVDHPGPGGSVAAYISGEVGPVTRADLPMTEPDAQPLAPITRVGGPVMTMDTDGRALMVGADRVYALEPDGSIRWTRRMPDAPRHVLPSSMTNNVERVGLSPDGRSAFVWTYRWNDKERVYEDANVILFDPQTGNVLGSMNGAAEAMVPAWPDEYDLRPPRFMADGRLELFVDRDGKAARVAVHPGDGRVQPLPDQPQKRNMLREQDGYRLFADGRYKLRLSRTGEKDVTFEAVPYLAHTRLLPGGRVFQAGTQGHLKMNGPDGSTLWSSRRAARIDDVALLNERQIALTWKHYLHRYDWMMEPVVEIVDLDTGSTVRKWAGRRFDDFGHYGPALKLTATPDGRQLFLGASNGDIYRIQP